jgi:Zn-dependent protease
MDIRLILVQAFVVLFAITVHEAAHAWMANRLGDPTAAALGRASLNPLVHIDPIGTVLFPLMLMLMTQGRGPVFGWAKPVPYNPYNLRQPKKGGLWIAFAGPIANILTAACAVLFYQVLKRATVGAPETTFLINILTAVGTILFYTALINLALAVFNLIPIPPLDGSGILTGLLHGRAAERYERLRPYGFLLLLLLMFSRVLNLIFAPVYYLVGKLFS